MDTWRLGDGMCRQELDEPDGLEAQVGTNQVLALERPVAFVEHQIEALEHCPHPCRQLDGLGKPDLDLELAQTALGSDDSLCHGRGSHQKRAGDLLHAEATHRLEHQRHLGVPRRPRVATGEHERKLVVIQFGRKGGSWGLEAFFDALREPLHLVLARPPPPVATKHVERSVLRHASDPSRRVLGHPVVRPAPQGRQEGLLDDVFHQV